MNSEREYEAELEKLKMNNHQAAQQEFFEVCVCTPEQMDKYKKEMSILEKNHLKKLDDLRKKYKIKPISKTPLAIQSTPIITPKIILRESIGHVDPRDNVLRTNYKF